MPLQLQIVVKDNGSAAIQNVNKNIRQLDKSTSIFGNSLAKTGSILESAFAATAMVGAVGKFIASAEEQVRVNNKLIISAANVGQAHLVNIKQVNDLTAAYQKKTNFGDEEQIAALGTLTTITGDYAKALEYLPQVMNFATFAGKDLKTAAEDYGKATQGNLMMLAKLFPELNKLKEQGVSTAEIMDKVNKRISGLAEADLSNLKYFTNAIGDAGEKVGDYFLPSLKIAADLFGQMPEQIEAVAAALPVLALAFKTAGGPITIVAAVLTGIGYTYGQIQDKISRTAMLTDAYADKVDNVLKAKEALTVVEEEYNKALDEQEQKQRVLDNLMKAGKTVDEDSQARKDFIAAVGRVQKLRDLSERYKKIIKNLSGTKPPPSAPVQKGETDEDFDSWYKKQRQGIIKSEKEDAIKKLDEISAFLDQRIAFEESYYNKSRDMAVQATETKLDDLALEYEREIEMAEKLGADKTLINQMYLESYKKIKAEEMAAAEFAAIRQSAMAYQMAGDVAGALAQLNEAAKGSARATQGLLVMQAIANTASGIMAIWGNPNPMVTFPQRVAESVVVGATGAAQILRIKSQKLADGGWVQGAGTSRSDNVPTMLSPRERVLSVREIERNGGQNAIDRAINAGTAGRGSISVNIAGSIVAPNEWLRDELLPAIERELSR